MTKTSAGTKAGATHEGRPDASLDNFECQTKQARVCGDPLTITLNAANIGIVSPADLLKRPLVGYCREVLHLNRLTIKKCEIDCLCACIFAILARPRNIHSQIALSA
jgi:hypothetical protein